MRTNQNRKQTRQRLSSLGHANGAPKRRPLSSKERLLWTISVVSVVGRIFLKIRNITLVPTTDWIKQSTKVGGREDKGGIDKSFATEQKRLAGLGKALSGSLHYVRKLSLVDR